MPSTADKDPGNKTGDDDDKSAAPPRLVPLVVNEAGQSPVAALSSMLESKRRTAGVSETLRAPPEDDLESVMLALFMSSA